MNSEQPEQKEKPKTPSPQYKKQPSLRQYIQLNPGYYDDDGQFIPGNVVKCPFSDEKFNVEDKTGLDIFLKHLMERLRASPEDRTKGK